MTASGQLPQILVGNLPADAALLDVREDDEWDAGHAPGARHLPLHQVPGHVGEIAEGTVVLCRSGHRSASAVAWLATQGVRTQNLTGGMQAWADAGRPVVTDDGRPGYVA